MNDTQRKKTLGVLSGTGLAIGIGLVVLLNLISYQAFFRLDLTSDQRYSLSPGSRSLVRSLEDPLTLKLYLTEGLPQPYGTQGRYIKDLLGDYRTASRGKIRLEVINPEKNEKARAEAQSSGAIPAKFTQVASDQFQVREGYMGVALFYQDKKETIPFVKDVGGLEYDISSRIKRMVSVRKKIIGYVMGQGQMAPDTLRSGPTSRLFDLFDVEPIQLATQTVRPDLLFVLAPQNQYKPEEIAVLDNFLAQGTPIALFMNRRVVNKDSFRSFAQTTGLEPWINHYGIDMSRDFVLDAQCQRIQVQSKMGYFSIMNIVNYPPIPLANKLNKDHPLTKTLDYLGFPFVHPLTVTVQGNPKLKATVLAESSPASWAPQGMYDLDPFSIRQGADTDPKGPFPLIALVEGSTTSFSKPDEPISNLKLLVCGSAFFASPDLPNPEGNANFLVNLAEWMSQDANLLAIPAKGSPFRPLRQVDKKLREPLKLAVWFVLPLGVVLAAFLRWRRRKKLREVVAKTYRPLKETLA